MLTFDEYLEEARDDDQDLTTKKALVNFIAANFYKFINKPEGEGTKSLMLLVAALGILNTSDDISAINAARRLATAALVTKGK